MRKLSAYVGKFFLATYLLTQEGHAKVCVDFDAKEWKFSSSPDNVTVSLDYIYNKNQSGTSKKSDEILKSVDTPVTSALKKRGKCVVSLKEKNVKSIRGTITVNKAGKEYGVQCNYGDRDFTEIQSGDSSIIVSLSGNIDKPKCTLETKKAAGN